LSQQEYFLHEPGAVAAFSHIHRKILHIHRKILVMSSPSSNEDSGIISPKETDSGYASAAGSEFGMPELYFTKPYLRFLNRQLQVLEPLEILRWATTTLPHLYQSTAFGMTGLVTLDMLSKMNSSPLPPQMVDVIFLDTLHHFSETLSLVDRIRERYPLIKLHVYRPDGVSTAQDFARVHGNRLWETNDQLYDWHAKVEPAQRAYRELNVHAVFTGRRRSQGGKRGELDVVEVDDAGLIKVNPLANWTFQQVQDYINANDVPYNELLDRGFKSVGDWHSTKAVAAGEDERAGRWAGQQKTECGIHNPRSKYAQYLKDQQKLEEQLAIQHALQRGPATSMTEVH
jgi:phosphoadenosine phosphosulfate reductase